MVFQKIVDVRKLARSWRDVVGAEGGGSDEVETRRESARRRIGVPG